jgi:hypothetical protein
MFIPEQAVMVKKAFTVINSGKTYKAGESIDTIYK